MQSRGGGIVPDLLTARALERWALGRPDEALALARKARELDPLSSVFIIKEADFLLGTRQLDEAAGLYENIIGTEPGDSRAYFGLAEVRRAQGRFDEAIDARRRGDGGWGDGGWEVVTHGGRTPTGLDALAWAERVCALGAGEILLTSMDRDGTKRGYDIALLQAMGDAVDVPIIASGGVGTLEHLYEGAAAGGAGAVLAASIFHFGDHTVREAKAYLGGRGIVVRP